MDGHDLKARRLALGFTQKQLAEQLGYTANYIYMLENGKAPISSPKRLDALLATLELATKLKPKQSKKPC